MLEGADLSKKRTTFAVGQGPVSGLAFSQDSKRLFVAGVDNEIRVFSTQDWKPVGKLVGHKAAVTAMALSPDGKWLASGDASGGQILWELKQ